MTTNRFDRTIRTVMWLDAFLSVAFVVACVLAAPMFATVGVPHAMRFAVGMVCVVSAVLLGVFGPIYAVLLMMRMHRGQYLLPRNLVLPLPNGMRPKLVTRK